MTPNYQILYAVQPSAPYAATPSAPSISLVLIRPRFPETALVLPRDSGLPRTLIFNPLLSGPYVAQPSAPQCRPAISPPMLPSHQLSYAAPVSAPSISLALLRPRFPEIALVLPRDF